MVRWGVLLLLAGLAQPVQATPRPLKLALVIQVDGLRTDLYQRYRDHFAGGLARFGRGAFFPYASASADPVGRLATQVTSPGITGVVTGTNSTPPGFRHRWTWNGTMFADNAKASSSRVLPVANRAIGALIASAEPPLVPPEPCATAAKSAHFARSAGDLAAFSISPALDGAVLAVGAGMIGELRMGVDSSADVIFLRLPALAKTVSTFGAGSEATCLHLLSIDRDLAGFFSQLDRGGLDYVAVLSGTGESTAPLLFWKTAQQRIESRDSISPQEVTATLSALLGLRGATQREGRCLDVVAAPYCPR